jgi:hypothetical protein
MLTKKEAARLTAQENALCALGFTPDEAKRLRRISLTLRRWHELECGTDNGHIERDETTGQPMWVTQTTYSYRRWPVADRESGALRRLGRIMAAHAPLTAYIQPDPRGAALYILRPGDVPAGASVDSYYSRGLCVY